LLADNIRNNQKTQVREATQRTNEHTNFLTKQKEHRFALAAVDEAITLVQRLKNPRHSLIEMRSAKNSLHKLSTSLTSDHATIAPLISALLELSRNFSNKKAIQQILDLL
jgi:6-phosphogluconate dehydrogenase